MARAGLYRERVTFLLPADAVPDGVGGFLPSSDQAEFKAWARVEQLRGGQLIALGKELESKGYKITTRYRLELLDAGQVVFNGKMMRLTGATSDEKYTQLFFYALNVS